jgi:hypothetical protein
MAVHDGEIVLDPAPDVGGRTPVRQRIPLGQHSQDIEVDGLADDVEDLALVLEVGVETRPGNAAGGGDRVDGRAGVSALEEQPAAGLQDRRPGALAPGVVPLALRIRLDGRCTAGQGHVLGLLGDS